MESEKTQPERTFSRADILKLLHDNGLMTWFQPIFSTATGKIAGYEALTRLSDPVADNGTIADLFLRAQEEGLTPWLDTLCQKNAFSQAVEDGIFDRDAYLYVNVCPESLIYQDICEEIATSSLLESLLRKGKIVLEITEQEAIRNYDLFKDAIERYRDMGFKIAIDDFGAGYGGLKMLSIITPDFVKIDRHFVTNINQDSFKYNLVDAIATVCHKLGITLIAEGIEHLEELEVMQHFGIELLQGFYLERPQPYLSDKVVVMPMVEDEFTGIDSDIPMDIGQLCREGIVLSPKTELMTAYLHFMKNEACRSIPVVDNGRIAGLLCRSRFLETHMVGPLGYGFALSKHRVVGDILENDFLLVKAETAIEDVIDKVQGRGETFLYDDICVSRNGYYYGVVGIYALLEATNQRNIQLARGANPLTGLPGNEFIQRTVSRFINDKTHFDTCYIDIDNFKPYNDYYGFEKGDMVILALADIVVNVVKTRESRRDFVGHIGGDDFIAITRSNGAYGVCRKIIAEFEQQLATFHSNIDLENGGYFAMDRQGNEVKIPLLSISIGIVNSADCHLGSYAELSGLASEVKCLAKAIDGSAIFQNRRRERCYPNTTVTIAA